MNKIKRLLTIIGLILFTSSISAEVYTTHFLTIDYDLDYLNFVNNTSDDLIIKFDYGFSCNYISVHAKSNEKIKIGIEANNNAWIDVPVRFEVKTKDMKDKKVSWTMNNKKSDINIILEEDQGWNF